MDKRNVVAGKNYNDMNLAEIKDAVITMSPAEIGDNLLPQVEGDLAKMLRRYGNPSTYKGNMRMDDMWKMLTMVDIAFAVLGSENAQEEYSSYEKAAEELEFKKINFKTGKRRYNHKNAEKVKDIYYNKIPATAFYRARKIGNYVGTLLNNCSNTKILYNGLMEENIQSHR